MNYEYIIFDLDGTIADSKIGVTKAVQYTLNKFGIEVTNLKELEKFIGPPIGDSFKDFYDFDEEKSEKATNIFRKYYGEECLLYDEIYKGVESTLKELKSKDKKLFIATSKPTPFAKIILDHFDLSKYFDIINGSDLSKTSENKKEIIEYVLDNGAIENKAKAIMVGDRKFDVIAARENGLDCIGVTYGYGSYEELKEINVKHIIDNIQEIISLV